MSILPFRNREIVQREMIDLLPRLRRFARGLCNTRFEADDLVQSACEKALSKSDQYKVGSRLDSWLYRIIHTSWLDEIRRKKVRYTHLQVVRSQVDDNRGNGLAKKNDLGAKIDVEKALRKLSSEHRAALILVSVEGYSYSEAANILNIAAGTVASRVARARSTMNDLLKYKGAQPTQRNTVA